MGACAEAWATPSLVATSIGDGDRSAYRATVEGLDPGWRGSASVNAGSDHPVALGPVRDATRSGHLLAVADPYGVVVYVHGSPRRRLPHADPTRVVVSKERIASANRYGLRVWSVETGATEADCTWWEPGAVEALGWRDDHLLARVAGEGWRWSPEAPDRVRPFAWDPSFVEAERTSPALEPVRLDACVVAWSAGGRLACGYGPGVVVSEPDGGRVRVPEIDGRGSATSLAWSQAGQLAIGTEGGSVLVWDGWRVSEHARVRGAVSDVCWLGDEVGWLAEAGVRVPGAAREVLSNVARGARSLAAAGGCVALGLDDGRVVAARAGAGGWSRYELRELVRMGRVLSVAWSADGTHLAAAADDGGAASWTFGEGEPAGRRYRGVARQRVPVAWSTDGRLAFGMGFGVIVHEPTGAVAQAEVGVPMGLSFSPDGVLAVATKDAVHRLTEATRTDDLDELLAEIDRREVPDFGGACPDADAAAALGAIQEAVAAARERAIDAALRRRDEESARGSADAAWFAYEVGRRTAPPTHRAPDARALQSARLVPFAPREAIRTSALRRPAAVVDAIEALGAKPATRMEALRLAAVLLGGEADPAGDAWPPAAWTAPADAGASWAETLLRQRSRIGLRVDVGVSAAATKPLPAAIRSVLPRIARSVARDGAMVPQLRLEWVVRALARQIAGMHARGSAHGGPWATGLVWDDRSMEVRLHGPTDRADIAAAQARDYASMAEAASSLHEAVGPLGRRYLSAWVGPLADPTRPAEDRARRLIELAAFSLSPAPGTELGQGWQMAVDGQHLVLRGSCADPAPWTSRRAPGVGAVYPPGAPAGDLGLSAAEAEAVGAQLVAIVRGLGGLAPGTPAVLGELAVEHVQVSRSGVVWLLPRRSTAGTWLDDLQAIGAVMEALGAPARDSVRAQAFVARLDAVADACTRVRRPFRGLERRPIDAAADLVDWWVMPPATVTRAGLSAHHRVDSGGFMGVNVFAERTLRIDVDENGVYSGVHASDGFGHDVRVFLHDATYDELVVWLEQVPRW